MKVVKIVVLTLMAISVVALAGAYTIQTDNKGAPEMSLDGGKNGPVPFPHLAHQTALTELSASATSCFPRRPVPSMPLKPAASWRSKTGDEQALHQMP